MSPCFQFFWVKLSLRLGVLNGVGTLDSEGPTPSSLSSLQADLQGLPLQKPWARRGEM